MLGPLRFEGLRLEGFEGLGFGDSRGFRAQSSQTTWVIVVPHVRLLLRGCAACRG